MEEDGEEEEVEEDGEEEEVEEEEETGDTRETEWVSSYCFGIDFFATPLAVGRLYSDPACDGARQTDRRTSSVTILRKDWSSV